VLLHRLLHRLLHQRQLLLHRCRFCLEIAWHRHLRLRLLLKVLLNMKVSVEMKLKWKKTGKRRNVPFG
jgi:hypothetical protein